MGILGAMACGFFAVVIVIVYCAVFRVTVSRSRHIWGAPISESDLPKMKRRYDMGIVVIIVLVIALPSIISKSSKPKEDTNTVETQENTTQESDQPEVVFDMNFGPFADIETNHKIISSIYWDFVERIQGKSKLEKITISLSHFKPDPYELYRQEEYGWYNEFLIIIKIADDDKTVYEGLPMMGNNLFYYFGGGKRPGMEISKEHAAYFYGFKKNMIVRGEKTFVDNDFCKIIDGLVLK